MPAFKRAGIFLNKDKIMSLWDTVKAGASSAIKEAAPIGIQLLKDEVGMGKDAVPETRPDTKSQPIATTQKFEPVKAFPVSKPIIIGGSVAAALLVGFLVLRKR